MKTSKLRLISYLFIVIIVALFSLNTVNIKSLDNYYITTKQEFIDYLLSEDADMEASYILTSDLDFTTGIVTYKGKYYNLDSTPLVIQPIGESKNGEGKVLSSYYNPFKGTFNGSGYIIRGLHIRSEAEDNEYVGLFGYNQGIISNLGLVDSTVEGGIHVGGIAGYNMGIIMGCYNTSEITGIGTIGGITGINYGYIRNSYNTGFVGGATKVGGIVGQNSNVISAVYDLGIISGEITEEGNKEFGYIFGYNSEQGIIGYVESDTGKTFYNPYQAYEEAGAYYSEEYDIGVGYNVGYTMGQETFYDNVNVHVKTLEELKNLDNYDSGFTNPKYNIRPISSDLIHQTTGFYIRKNSDYPFPVVGISESTTKDHVENSLNKNGFKGAGTIYKPFLIEDETDLKNIYKSLTSAYKLVNNIEMTSYIEPIGEENNEFRGIFNGNGKRISNLEIITEEEVEYLGLFAFNSGIIHNLSLDVEIIAPNASKIGSFAGFNNGLIYEVYALGEIVGNTTIGGIVGSNELGTIKNSYNLANVSGVIDIGGIAGFNSGEIHFVYNANTPKVVDEESSKNIGAIVGYNENTNNLKNVQNAVFFIDDKNLPQIGHQTSTQLPYSNSDNQANSYEVLKSITLYSEFDITELSSGGLATTVWAKEPGVNDNLPYLTKTQPFRVTELVVDRTKELIVDDSTIKLFDELGNLIIGTDADSYGNEIDLNYFVSVLPVNAENKKINYYIVSGEAFVEINGSILKGLNHGEATIKAVSEDGAKEAVINVIVRERVNELFFTDENDNVYNDEIYVENLSDIYIYPKSNIKNPSFTDFTLEISANNFLIDKGNGLYGFDYYNPSNLVVNGEYSNEVSVNFKITTTDNTVIEKTLKIILKPSSKTYTDDLIKLIENTTNLNYIVIDNKVKLVNDQEIKYDSDFIILEINSLHLQQVNISSSNVDIVQISENQYYLYINKGDVIDDVYQNRLKVVEIEITSEAGFTDTYNLELIKELSPITELSGITISDGINSYPYKREGNRFIVDGFISFAVEELFIEAMLLDLNSEYSKSRTHKFYYWLEGLDKSEDGIISPKKEYSQEIIYLEVVSEKGTSEVYEIELNYDFALNDKLDNLFIGEFGGDNLIDYDKDQNDYHIRLDYDANLDLFLSYKIYPNSNQRVLVSIDGSELLEINNINFTAAYDGLTLVWVFVQSYYNYINNIEEFNTYLISIVRDESSEAELHELKVNDEVVEVKDNMNHLLDKEFNGNVTINLVTSRFAKVEVKYISFTEQVTNNEYLYNLVLNPISGNYFLQIEKGGSYLVEITVISEDGLNTKKYTLEVNKSARTNPLIEKIIVDGIEYTEFVYDDISNSYKLNQTIEVPYEKANVSMVVYLDELGFYELVGSWEIYYLTEEVVDLNLNTGLNTIGLVSYAEDYHFYFANYEFTIKREYNSNTPYKVNHYKQNFDGTYYLDLSEELTGLAYSNIEATPQTFTGFTFDPTVNGTLLQGIIAEDGSLELKLFYKRNEYNLNVIFNDSIGEVIGEVGKIKYDYNVVLTATSNQGYEFLGWYVNNTLVSGNPIYEFKMPANDLNIEARFNIETYQITYHLDGGVNNPGNVTTYNLLDLDIMLLEPEKAGYQFMGWYLNPEFTGSKVQVIDFNLLGDLNLYARWIELEEVEYQVHIYKEALDGSYILETIENYSAYVNDIVTATINVFEGFTFEDTISTKSGTVPSDETLILSLYYSRNTYNLEVVNLNPEGGIIPEGISALKYEEFINLSATPTKGYRFIGWFIEGLEISSELDLDYYMPSSDVVITAKFELIVYEISYVIDNNAINPNPLTYTVLDLPLTLLEPSIEGYSFVGWYLDSEYNTLVEVIDDDLLGDITLYAKVNIITYNITVIIDGEIVDAIVVNHGDTIEFSDYSKDGYELNGWYLDEDLESPFNLTTQVKENLTLYGRYELIEYSIVYHLDDGVEVGGTNPTKYTILTGVINLYPLEKEGYNFLGWYDKDDNLVELIEAESTGDLELFAKFEIIQYELIIKIIGRGKVYLNSVEVTEFTLLVDYGSTLNLEFVPDTDFEIEYIKINENTYEDINSYVLDNITSNNSIEVKYSGAEPDVLTLIPGSGYGDKVYEIDRSREVNLFLNYYIKQTAKAIRDSFENSPDRIKFYDNKDNEISDDSILGTGYMIKLYNHDYTEVLDTVYVVLVGDTDGDGDITALDANLVIRHIKLVELLEKLPYIVAAETTYSNMITAIEVNLIIRHIKLLELLYN